MAAGNIWTRIQVNSNFSLPSEHQRLDIHKLGSAMRLRAAGKITDAQFVSAFNLDVDGSGDFEAMKTAYTAAADKAEWMHLVESCFILVDGGNITEANAKTFLGII